MHPGDFDNCPFEGRISTAMVAPRSPTHCSISHWRFAVSSTFYLVALAITALLVLGLLWAGAVRTRPAAVEDLKLKLLSYARYSKASRKDLAYQPLSAFCTAEAFSKQSCIFGNVCFVPEADRKLTVLLPAHSHSKDLALLKRHLNVTLQGVFDIVNISSGTDTAWLTSNGTVWDDHAVTMLWRSHVANQESFGHALVNEAFPAFMVLQNHYGQDIPPHMQLLVTSWWHEVLQHVLLDTISNSTLLLHERLQQLLASKANILCFPRLLLGDGGYIAASRASLANSGQHESTSYSTRPTFFSSSNWWGFRRHTLQASGVEPQLPEAAARTRPLILLNDKRHGPNATADRRMIMNIDQLAADIQAAYPAAEVVAARFRDMQWAEQLQLLSRASVFITTQGSSAFRLVFLPRGSTCIMLGAPDGPGTVWKSFHELDRWFPLAYVRFERYMVSAKNTSEYKVNVVKGHWQPPDTKGAKDWWLYNADVAVDIGRLRPMLDRALGNPIL